MEFLVGNTHLAFVTFWSFPKVGTLSDGEPLQEYCFQIPDFVGNVPPWRSTSGIFTRSANTCIGDK